MFTYVSESWYIYASLVMEERSCGPELEFYVHDTENASRSNNMGNLSPREDYNPLEDCL